MDPTNEEALVTAPMCSCWSIANPVLTALPMEPWDLSPIPPLTMSDMGPLKARWEEVIAETESRNVACLPVVVNRGVLKSKKKAFVMPTETNVQGDAVCFMVKTWAIHKTTVLNNG